MTPPDVREGAGREAANTSRAGRPDARGRRSSVRLAHDQCRPQSDSAASMTGIGSGFVVVLAGISIF
jgi:hypothetical protein